MHTDYLEFEQPIAELEEKIKELRLVGSDNKLNITEEIEKLQSQVNHQDIFFPVTLAGVDAGQASHAPAD